MSVKGGLVGSISTTSVGLDLECNCLLVGS